MNDEMFGTETCIDLNAYEEDVRLLFLVLVFQVQET